VIVLYLISFFTRKSNLNLRLLSSVFCSVGITLNFSFYKIKVLSLSVSNIVFVVLFVYLCRTKCGTLFFTYYDTKLTENYP